MKNKLIELALKENIQIEITENLSKCTDINIINGKEKLFQITKVSTYIIKAIKDSKCVKIVTESLKNPKMLIENIQNILAIQENNNKNSLSKGHITNKLEEKENLDYNIVKKDLISLENLKEKFPEIIAIESSYSHYGNGNYINNSNSELIEEYSYNEFGIKITAEKNNKRQIKYVFYYSQNYNFDKFKAFLLEKTENLILKLESDSCKTNKYNIILKNTVVADILKTFSSSFQAKNILLKESVLSNKFEKKVFSDKISIIEDPQNKNAIINCFFDSEGTPTTYKEIIKNGVFIKKLNNIEYALKTNEKPTGNASGVNNLYIKPGKSTFNELVSELGNGIIIDEVYGLHSGIDIKSGNISIQAEGLEVKNGKMIKGLNMIILSTNIFELFSNVNKVGNDLSNSLLNISAPSLLLENITIAGKK